MRASEGFVLGAITGAVVVWFWGQEIEDYLEEKTRGMRAKAAAAMRAVEEGAGKVFGRGGEALRRAEDVLQDTKEHVSQVLQTGQETVRPVPTNGKA